MILLLLLCLGGIWETFSFQNSFHRIRSASNLQSLESKFVRPFEKKNHERLQRCFESRIFSSKREIGGGTNRDLPNSPIPIQKREIILNIFRTFVTRTMLLRKFLWTRMTKMQQAAKVFVGCFLFAVALKYIHVLPSSGDSIIHSRDEFPMGTIQKPVEIPYSRFMDYCEKRQRSKSVAALLNRQPIVELDRIKVEESGKTIGFRMIRADSAQEKRALREYVQTKEEKHLESLPKKSQGYTQIVNTNPEVLEMMRINHLEFQQATKKPGDDIEIVPTVIIGAVAYHFYKQMGPSVSNKGAGTLVSKRKDGTPLASFDHIEGIDEAKRDVMELVDALTNPETYQLVGARAPRGLLLEGPPGTGKTTLAKACASVAGVPLISCSGSSFVERYVGTGAARVRQLFAKAEKLGGPCIIFIDEIDALGKARRDNGGSGNSDESEQTLNQLLACMDGLDSNTEHHICVLGATNRKDVLDPALVRPGRFE